MGDELALPFTPALDMSRQERIRKRREIIARPLDLEGDPDQAESSMREDPDLEMCQCRFTIKSLAVCVNAAPSCLACLFGTFGELRWDLRTYEF